MLGVYTILEAAERGWGSAHTLGLGAVAVALIAAFVARQARIDNPLMPLRLFRSRNVAGANIIQALLVVGMFGTFFLGALYLQRILGYGALEVGLAFLPATLVMGVMSLRFSGPLALRFGPRATLVPSLLAIGAGLVLFAQTPVDGDYARHIMPPMILMGFGAGLGFPSLMTLAMSGATPSDSAWRPGSSTRACRSAARSGSPCSPRSRRSARTRCGPTARPPRSRSTAASISPI